MVTQFQKTAACVIMLSGCFFIEAAQRAPGNRGRAIPMAFDRSRNDWSILLSHKVGDPANLFTDFAADLQHNKLPNMIATDALHSQTSGAYSNRILIDNPKVTLSNGDVFYFVAVPFTSGSDLYQRARNNNKDDFMWVSASDILNRRPIMHARRGAIGISNAVKDVLVQYLPDMIQQLNASRAAQPMPAQPQQTQMAAQIRLAPGQTWFTIPNALLFYQSGQPYYEFTNFYVSPITIDGRVWPTTEHYFQAQKFADPRVQERIRNLPSARDAFNEGRNRANMPRADWDNAKIGVMLKAVRAKFNQNQNLKSMLLSTGNSTIVENAGANDTYWGAGADGRGQNYLGRILMHVREELRNGREQQFAS